jgi:hypothetical protein
MEPRTHELHRQTFLVEHYRPESRVEELERLGARAAAALRRLQRKGRPVRLLRSVVVPGYESLLSLVEAASERIVREAHTQSGIQFRADLAEQSPVGLGNGVNMRGKILVASGALVLAGLVAGVTGGAAGVGKSTPKLAASRPIEGTWLSRVTLENPPPGVEPTFSALNTFGAGGRLLVSSSQTMPVTRSLAHGEWVRTGNRRYVSSFVAFRFDPTGKYAGTLQVRREMTLAPSLNEFQSTDIVEFVAPDGTVIASFRATEAATRMKAA